MEDAGNGNYRWEGKENPNEPPAPPPPPLPPPPPAPQRGPRRPEDILRNMEKVEQELHQLQDHMRVQAREARNLLQDYDDPAQMGENERVKRGRGRGRARGPPRAGRFLGARNARYWKGQWNQQRRPPRGGGGSSGCGPSFNPFCSA